MQEPRRVRHQPRSMRSATARAAGVLTATLVLLVACGGGGGGGNGETGDNVVHTLIINASPDDVTVQYIGAEPGDDIPLPTCTAELLDFPLADPFQVIIDGTTVIDTDVDLPDGLPNAIDGYSDLIVEIAIDKDGVASFDRIRPGSGLTKPSKASYCASLPG